MLFFFKQILESLYAGGRPRVLLLADKPGWVFDYVAGELKKLLKDEYYFDVKYVRKAPHLKANNYDLVYIFFWGETFHLKTRFDPHCIIKEVSSYRWIDDPRYGPCTPDEFRDKFLRETQAITCTSLGMIELLKETHDRIYHAPNGINPKQIHYQQPRRGKMKIGWAGNSEDPVKQQHILTAPECMAGFDFVTAPGTVPRHKLSSTLGS